jgi:PAS domain S-box-containing protein
MPCAALALMLVSAVALIAGAGACLRGDAAGGYVVVGALLGIGGGVVAARETSHRRTAVAEDVTRLRWIEDELRHSREHYAGLVENALDPLLTFDTRGRLLSANPAMERMVQRRAADLYGMHFLAGGLLARSSRRAAVRIARALAGTTTVGPQTLELIRRNGTSVHVEPYHRVVRGAGGSVVVEVVLRDVTERRRAEEAVRWRAYAAHLDALRERERSLFARRLHDEFAQPLAALGLHLGALSRTLPSDLVEPAARLGEMTAVITSVLTSMRIMIDDLRPAVLDDFGLAAALRWEARDFQRRTGIECIADVETDDQDGLDDRAVVVFRTLQAALDDVVVRGASRVRVQCRIAGGAIAVEIEDNGAPLAASSLSWEFACMRERLRALGGRCDVVSPARGCVRVCLRVS